MRKLLTFLIAPAAMRRFLIACGLCLWANCAWAVLAIDGSVAQGNTGLATTVATAGTVNGSNTNDIIVAFVVLTRTNAQGSAITLAASGGITDTLGLTWTKRSQFSFHSGATGTDFVDIEVWWALRAATTSTTVTAHTAGAATFDNATIAAFAISGANTSTPWDTNGSLPATATSSGNTASAPTVTGVSTSCDKTMAIAFTGAARSVGAYTAQTAGTGYTIEDAQAVAPGNDFAGDGVEQQIFAATQPGISPAFAVATWTGWIASADAIQDATASCGGAPSGPPRGSLMMMGVGR
jgi:hypothetical protein